MGVKKGADVKKRILTPAEERLLVLYKRMQEELVDVKATVKLDMSSYQESKLKPNESTLQDPKAQAAQVWAQTQMKVSLAKKNINIKTESMLLFLTISFSPPPSCSFSLSV